MEGTTRIGRLGLAGYPGYIFLQKIRYGYGAQRYDEKRTILHNWYSGLRAYLPMHYHIYDEDGRYENKKAEFTDLKYRFVDDEGNETKVSIALLLIDASGEIKAARLAYKSTFENPDIYDPAESAFEELLEGIQERLDDITAITGIIDKARVDDEYSELTAG